MLIRRVVYCRSLRTAVAALTTAAAFSPAAAADDASRRVLEAHGLVNLGEAWLCPAEVEARRWLDALDPLDRQYQTLQRAVDDRVRANEVAKAELAAKRAELKRLEERIDKYDPAAIGPTRDQLKQSAKEVEAQIKRLRHVYKDGSRLAEFQPARDEVIRLANARAGLTLAAAALRRRLGEIPNEYDRLAKIPEVRTALARLGPTERLGAARNYEAEAAERLARIDRATLSNVVPIYRDDNHPRVVAVVNGSTPVTFSLRYSDSPTHLPHSLISSLGIDTTNARRATYTVGNRKLACRVVTLASVRIGGLELRDVEAIALPPEGEDLGAKLGRAAYASHYFDVDFSQLRLTIMTASPREDSAKADGNSQQMRKRK